MNNIGLLVNVKLLGQNICPLIYEKKFSLAIALISAVVDEWLISFSVFEANADLIFYVT
jgi:hypothetical protein